jgi:hypothetical protein
MVPHFRYWRRITNNFSTLGRPIGTTIRWNSEELDPWTSWTMRNHRERRAGFGFPHGFPMVFPWFSHGFPVPTQKKKSFSRARAPTRQSKLRWEGAIHRLILLVFLCQKKYMWPDRELRTGIIRCPMHPPYAGGASRARPLAPQLCYEKMTHVGQKTTKSNNPLKGLSWGKWIYHTSTNLMVPLI